MDPALLILKDRFQRAFAEAGLAAPKGVFEALAERYSEPPRAYHTLQHISEGLAHLAGVRRTPPEVVLAWWFHDAIYDPKRQDNEARSAAWAGVVIGEGPLKAKVEALILATKPGIVPGDPAARLLVDVDLAILAAAEPRYSEYEAQTRQEFSYLDEAAYRRERFQVLRSFSDRAFIYGSPEFRNLETRARKNLERSINKMIAGKR